MPNIMTFTMLGTGNFVFLEIFWTFLLGCSLVTWKQFDCGFVRQHQNHVQCRSHYSPLLRQELSEYANQCSSILIFSSLAGRNRFFSQPSMSAGHCFHKSVQIALSQSWVVSCTIHVPADLFSSLSMQSTPCSANLSHSILPNTPFHLLNSGNPPGSAKEMWKLFQGRQLR